MGRAPALVLGEEVVDDGGAELAFGVDYIMTSADSRADTPGVVDVLEGAAAAAEGSGVGALLGVQAQRDADDLVALLRQQQRGDR